MVAPRRIEDKDELPPHNDQEERLTLACLFWASSSEAVSMADKLEDRLFYDQKHKNILMALRAVAVAGEPIDSMSLHRWILKNGKESDVGGYEYLLRLPDVATSPAQFEGSLAELQSVATRRDIVINCAKIKEMSKDICCSNLELAAEARRMVEKHSFAASSVLPDFRSVTALLADQTPMPASIIEGLLHRESLMVFGGASKSYKTWSLLDMALSVSCGEPFWRFGTRKCRVLYINLELQEPLLRDRLAAIAREKHIDPAKADLEIWTLRGHSMTLPNIVSELAVRMRGREFGLILPDPIYKLASHVNENAANEVSGLFANLETLAARTNASVAVGAHFAKGNASGKESQDRVSGSGVFARFPDTIATFTQHEEKDAYTVELTLRGFKPVEPFVVRWNYPLLRRDDDLDPARLKKPMGRTPEFTVDDALSSLNGIPKLGHEWEDATVAATRMSSSTFKKLKKQAVEQGLAALNPEGFWISK